MDRPEARTFPASWLPMGLGLALGLLAGFPLRFLVGTDLTCYLLAARDYASGAFGLAVSPYWSPLLSWLTVPATWLGIAPHLLAHTWGAVGLGARAWAASLLAERLGASPGAVLGSGILVALAGAVDVHRASDQWMGALFLAFLALFMPAREAAAPRDAPVLPGALAGLAYLAKAAALPHALLVAGVDLGLRRRGRDFAWFLLGLALLAGPWILVLSLRSGTPTLGAAGSVNLRAFAPDGRPEWHPYFQATRLMPPPQGRMHAWQVPETHPYPELSGLASPPGLAALRRRFREGLWRALRTVSGPDTDALCLRLLALAGLVATALGGSRALFADRHQARLLLAAVVSGVVLYLPVVNDQDRYYWVARDLLTVAAVVGAARLAAAAADPVSAGRRSVLLLGISLALPPAIGLLALVARPPVGEATVLLAARLRASGIEGPMAGSRFQALVVAYHLDVPFQGVPDLRSRRDLRNDLETAGTRTLLVWDEDPLARLVEGEPGFHRILAAPGEGGAQVSAYRIAFRDREGPAGDGPGPASTLVTPGESAPQEGSE